MAKLSKMIVVGLLLNVDALLYKKASLAVLSYKMVSDVLSCKRVLLDVL